MTSWAVIQTQAGREYAVDGRLARVGYETYFPRIRSRSQIAPLFPGYLFLHIVNGWSKARWTEGVIDLLQTCDQHSLQTIITNIRNSERNGFIPAQPRFTPGQKVNIATGPLAGQIATCATMKGEDRVCVLLELLGQLVTVDLPARNLHLAG